ncbi:MAG: cobalamin B12-binding domain-containing protein, partial [Shimia sp.]
AAPGTFRPDLHAALMASLREIGSQAQTDALDRFARAGIAPAEVIDTYLTTAAMELGDAWCEDTMTFAEVTIGSARLQAMLRDLGAPEPRDPAAPSILLLVPSGAHHTFGAGVLADRLRRAGLSVRLALGADGRTLSRQPQPHDFDAVFISASASETLETIRNLVDIVRRDIVPTPPICVGGSVLDRDQDIGPGTIASLTGADHCTRDPGEAIRACGLAIHRPAVASLGTVG